MLCNRPASDVCSCCGVACVRDTCDSSSGVCYAAGGTLRMRAVQGMQRVRMWKSVRVGSRACKQHLTRYVCVEEREGQLNSLRAALDQVCGWVGVEEREGQSAQQPASST
jgi:hypothetical protein